MRKQYDEEKGENFPISTDNKQNFVCMCAILKCLFIWQTIASPGAA